jgi:hypothetical protein
MRDIARLTPTPADTDAFAIGTASAVGVDVGEGEGGLSHAVNPGSTVPRYPVPGQRTRWH